MNGGARPNSGPKKGAKYAKTISKEQAREALRQIVLKRMERLAAAQLDNAEGIKHLMYRDAKTGKFERVTGSEDQIDAALKMGAVWIYTKDPSVQAFTDLMNRALDKPAEQVKVTGEDGGPVIFKWQE